VPGALKARFGASEVIVTIMMNFIVAAFLNWMVATRLNVAESLHTPEIHAGAGFLGIAVALVGRNHPVGIVIAALLFATLSQGALAVNALVPKQMVDVLTAIVIIAVAATVPEIRRMLSARRVTRA
jgi:ABC-type uncharacterized transport system permease subunit